MTNAYFKSAAIAVLALTLGLAEAGANSRLLEDTVVFTPDTRAKSGRTIHIRDEETPDGDAATIDVLIVYTPRILANLAASDYEFVEYVERSFAASNAFLRNSGLATRFRVAGLAHWDRPRGYDIRADMDALPDFVESQTRLRDETGADLVQFWETPERGIDEPGLCGWGHVIGSHGRISTRGFGYSVVLRGQPGSEFESCYAHSSPESYALLIAHEFGHNLGSSHGWDDSSGNGVFEYAHGAYCDNEQSHNQPGTIMTASRLRQPFFSNPALSYRGQACGRTADQPYPADNHRTFSRTARPVASLRAPPGGRGHVSLSAPASTAEFAPWFPLTLRRSDSREAASVELVIFSHRAIPGVHFDAPLSQRVSFAPGEHEVIVPIDLIADNRREPDKVLSFWLQRGANAGIGAKRSHTVTIRDNEYPRASEGLPPRPDHQPVPDSFFSSGPPQASDARSGGGALPAWLLAGLLLGPARRRPCRRRLGTTLTRPGRTPSEK